MMDRAAMGDGNGKQEWIVATLRGRILTGDLPPGEALPSNRQLCDAFGVAPVTVSRAIRRMVEAGYVVSRPRRGVFVADPPPHLGRFGVAFFAGPDVPAEWTRLFDVLYGVARRGLPECGAEFEVYTHIAPGPGRGDYDRLLRDLQEHRLGGILFASDPWRLAGIAGGAILNVPDMAYMGIMREGHGTRIHTVAFADLVEMALTQCVGRHRRKLAIMLSSSQLGRFDEAGFVARAHASGVTVRAEWIQYADLGYPPTAANLVHLLFAQPDAPDALLVADDNLLVPSEDGLLRAGVRVPEQVCLIGHTNYPPPVLHRLPADLIGYDIHGLLRTCVETFRALRGGATPGVTVIPCLPAMTGE